MNNYCRNCGEKLEKNQKVCHKCNAEVFEQRIDVEKKEKELVEFKKKEIIYITIIISIFVFVIFLHHFNFLEKNNAISPLLILGDIILLVYARITMNRSVKIKVIFYIFTGLIILYLISMLLLFISCLGMAELLNRGCN